MRVLQVVQSMAAKSGGPVRSILANCHAVHGVDRDIQTILVTTDQGLNVSWRKELTRRMPSGMEMQVFSSVGRHAYTFSLPLIRWIRDNVSDYDLVVLRGLLNPLNSVAARIANYREVPYIVVPHGTLSEYTFQYRRAYLKRAYFWLVERGTLNSAAAVRFTTEAERESAATWGSATPVSVIPHPFASKGPSGEAIPSVTGPVLFLSRFHPKKGLETLLAAMVTLNEQHPGTEMVLAGAGSEAYESHIKREIERFGLRSSVRLPGFVQGEQKRQLLSQASVFVLPSLQENFGVAVVEAMDAGLPVVITRGIGIWKEVRDAEAGLIVDRDPASIAEALRAILEDPALYQRMSENGHQLVKTRFNPEHIGHSLHSLYCQAADNDTEVSKVRT